MRMQLQVLIAARKMPPCELRGDAMLQYVIY